MKNKLNGKLERPIPNSKILKIALVNSVNLFKIIAHILIIGQTKFKFQ